MAEQDFGGKVELTLVDAWVGEGDAEHRYYYARVVVRARENFQISGGLFDGFAMSRTDPPHRFTIEMYYAWRGGRWQLLNRSLAERPEPA